MEGTEGTSARMPLQKLVIINKRKQNVNDLKTQLNEIIDSGPMYEYDITSCLKNLFENNDQEIVLLTIQAISELAKSDEQRELLSKIDIMVPILSILCKEVTFNRLEVIKQCCRALCNLCFNHNESRKIVFENNGVKILHTVLECCLIDSEEEWLEIVLLIMKTFLNYAMGGHVFSDTLVKGGLLESLKKILTMLYDKENTDSLMTTILMIITVINDNDLEIKFDPELNISVLTILKITQNSQIAKMCLDLLETQAEHDSVKTLLAREGGVNLVCVRTQDLIEKQEKGCWKVEAYEIKSLVRHACNFIVTVLTGDEAMEILYDNGEGEVYMIMMKWLDSKNYQLLTIALLAIGNFARRDNYCAQLMENKIYDKLLGNCISPINFVQTVFMRKKNNVYNGMQS